MPIAPDSERRDIGQLRAAQTQRNTSRRSSEFLKNIDDVLKEADDSDFSREARKKANTARLEKTFPGVEEDEKTLSGMYEPALHNFPLNENHYYPARPDTDQISEFRSPERLNLEQELRLFPKSQYHYEKGTGPADTIPRTREERQIEDSDADSNTPDFGTDRNERDYVNFEQSGPSEHPVGSDAYWNQMNRHTKSHRLREYTRNAREYTRNADRAAAAILGTTRRSRNPEAGPVTNSRTAAELMAQGNPARAGGRYSGSHNFRGSAGPAYHPGRLPRELSPNLRNIETDFTVYSYSTPIAWRATSGQWEVPRINYSRTTQRHQSAIRRALSNTHHSATEEASNRIYDLRERHLEEGLNLPSTKYRLSVGFETYHTDPVSEETVNRIVEDHVQQVINPAIERRRNSRSFQRQQRQTTQSQLPLEGGIA